MTTSKLNQHFMKESGPLQPPGVKLQEGIPTVAMPHPVDNGFTNHRYPVYTLHPLYAISLSSQQPNWLHREKQRTPSVPYVPHTY